MDKENKGTEAASAMKKDYAVWMAVKSSINNNLARPIGFKPRDIWICSLGENIGFEEDGKGSLFIRPALILKAFSNVMCHIVPLSTTEKRGVFYYEFDGHTGKLSVALLTQSRIVDSSRLRRKIGVVSKKDFGEIKKRIRDIFEL
jgi:mRNA-degrading endonuclease toxin of MazEF toxin-antitoxin module